MFRALNCNIAFQLLYHLVYHYEFKNRKRILLTCIILKLIEVIVLLTNIIDAKGIEKFITEMRLKEIHLLNNIVNIKK